MAAVVGGVAFVGSVAGHGVVCAKGFAAAMDAVRAVRITGTFAGSALTCCSASACRCLCRGLREL
eukprot:14626969-Alexandrium_andersonii.AAC.1